MVLDDTVIRYDLTSDGGNYRFDHGPASTRVNDPATSDQLMSVKHDTISFYSWSDLTETSVLGRIRAICSGLPHLSIQHVAPNVEGRDLGLIFHGADDRLSGTLTALLDCSALLRNENQLQILEPAKLTTASVEYIIGVKGSKLYFLDKDLWICSVALGTEGAKCVHHMFIPDEWLKANNRLLFLLMGKGELGFVKRDEIIVIKRPFTYSTIF